MGQMSIEKKALTKLLLNESIVRESNSLVVDSAKASLVDELTHTLQVGVSGEMKQSIVEI